MPINNPVSYLRDLVDVDVAGAADDDFFYYDDASGLWKPRALVDADIPASIARDSEVADAVDTHAALDTGVHGAGSDYLAISKSATLFALNAPTGTAEWKNRTYEGCELLMTATTYTVGTGGDFATLKEAADSLKGLILVASLTIQLVSNVTEDEPVLFDGLISVGGILIFDFNSYTQTINLSSGTGTPLAISGPVKARLDGGTLSLDHANKNPPWQLFSVTQAAVVQLNSGLTINANDWDGSRIITATTATIYHHQMPAANWLNHAHTTCVMLEHMGRMGARDTNPPSFNAGRGMFIDKDGYIYTAAGKFEPV